MKENETKTMKDMASVKLNYLKTILMKAITKTASVTDKELTSEH